MARIVINPTTFKNSKDALCVAFNEGFRLWMEANDFQPRSEPTEKQRRFFSDTAYADDETQLRRTILARIATFDTSVKDPTDDQLAETAEFLNAVLESDWCKNDWERNSVEKLARAVEAAVGAEPAEPREEPVAARPVEPRGGETPPEAAQTAQAALEGGQTDKETPIGPTQPGASLDASAEPAVQPAATPDEPAPAGEAAPTVENPGNPAEPQAAGPVNEPAVNEPPDAGNPLAGRSSGSGVWTGGEPGRGRQLTADEAAWMERRIKSGASVSDSQLSMFGMSRDQNGNVVGQDGALVAGSARPAAQPVLQQTRSADAGLDTARKAPGVRVRRLGEFGARRLA